MQWILRRMPDELPWWKVALAPQDNPLVYQVRGVLKSLIFPNGFPTGRVLVGEGVLTKACRKKPKPRYCILYRTVSCICVSKALNVPQTGNSSSSMICLSMETLWSTRKSTTNRWNIQFFEHKPILPFVALDSTGGSKIEILGGRGPVQEWLASMYQVDFRHYVFGSIVDIGSLCLAGAALIQNIEFAGASPLQCLLQLQQRSRSGWLTSTSASRWFFAP